MRDEKMKAKYIEEYVWKSFFRKLAGWYLSTSLWINFFTDNFPDLIKWTPLNDYFSLFYKMLEMYLGKSYCICFLESSNLYLHTISSLPDVFYKKDFWKSSQYSKINTWNSHPEVFCQKNILRMFAKFAGKHRCWSLFLIELMAWMFATLLERHPSTGVSVFCEFGKSLKRAFMQNNS